MRIWIQPWLPLVLLVSFSFASLPPPKENFRKVEKKILDKLFNPEIYDNRMRPQGKSMKGSNSSSDEQAPTVVLCSLMVRSFEKIDDVKMEFSVQITFRQQWYDNRLEFDDLGGKIKYLTMTDSNKVWMPDTFFRNEKNGKFHNIIQPNLYVRIHPNGDVLYSIRVSLTLGCPMNLELFPLDSQTCHIHIASYGWTADDVIYLWREDKPINIDKNLFLPGGFELARYADSKCDVKTATGVYSCLSLDMQFQRQLSYYVVTIYVPTFMIVCVSWMSFWLDHKSAPARVSLTITTLLAMATTTSSINSSMPPVSYIKAIDVWSNMCVSFVFLALLEYALVNYAARADARALELWRAAHKQVEIEQTETFDSKRNSGFKKEVKIHKSEYHEMQIQEPETDTETQASERKWQQFDEEMDRDRRDYDSYSYHESDYVDNRDRVGDWDHRDVDRGHETDGWRDRDHHSYYDRSRYSSWDRRNGGYSSSYYNDHDRGGYDRRYYRYDDYYYGSYGYHRWRDDYDDHHLSRRWSYDSYYDKDCSNMNYSRMNRYEKNHRRTNYYQNNGYDEHWDIETERDSYDTRNYPRVQNGYLNEQWNDDNGYHDNVTYDSRDETVFDDQHDQHQDVIHDTFDEKEGPVPENIPPDDAFENFKTGPFPKKRTSFKVKRDKSDETKTQEKNKEEKKESNWLKTKPIIKKRNSNKKKQETEKEKEKTSAGTNESPKAILFATLVPAIPALLKKSRTDRVKSILGTKFRFNFNPGAKRIDVISRVMFPGTFACLNIAYWAYYLTTAEQASLDSL